MIAVLINGLLYCFLLYCTCKHMLNAHTHTHTRSPHTRLQSWKVFPGASVASPSLHSEPASDLHICLPAAMATSEGTHSIWQRPQGFETRTEAKYHTDTHTLLSQIYFCCTMAILTLNLHCTPSCSVTLLPFPEPSLTNLHPNAPQISTQSEVPSSPKGARANISAD